jgi:choline dehydrogenase
MSVTGLEPARLRPVVRIGVVSMLLACGCAAEGVVPDRERDRTVPLEASYDYVVVGAGAGGGPLAARLAEAGHRVLLLEAGQDVFDSGSDVARLAYSVPAFHPFASEQEEISWAYYVEHYAEGEAERERDLKIVQSLDGANLPCTGGICQYAEGAARRGILYPRGTGIGGSGGVNAMITVLPKNSDWAALGAATQTEWPDMRPYYERVRSWLSVEMVDSNLALEDPKVLQLVGDTAFEFANARGGDWLDVFDDFRAFGDLRGDINERLLADGGGAEGVFTFPLATSGRRRSGVRDRVLGAAAHSSLTVATSSFVTRVLFDDPSDPTRATGVEYVAAPHVYRADRRATGENPERLQVNAEREVILSAGAFNTPQLLMLSGIGPSEDLAAHGIEPRVHSPGVGRNLQDRYEVGVVFERSLDFKILDGCIANPSFPEDPCLREWEGGGGPYTSNGAVVSVLLKSSDAQPEADLHVFGVPGVFRGYYPGYSNDGGADHRHFTWVILKGHTGNTDTGYVRLASSDPFEPPSINFRYFSNENASADLDAVVRAIHFVRNIEGEGMESDKLEWLIRLGLGGLSPSRRREVQAHLDDPLVEVWPGGGMTDDGELGQWVRDEAWGHHACGTARMGHADDPYAVLDERFRVRGTTNLRVVDASVFPRIPGTFIVLPIYMMSERAADVILEDAN